MKTDYKLNKNSSDLFCVTTMIGGKPLLKEKWLIRSLFGSYCQKKTKSTPEGSSLVIMHIRNLAEQNNGFKTLTGHWWMWLTELVRSLPSDQKFPSSIPCSTKI